MSNSKFIRQGLPFFSLILGGAFALHFFQKVRYDFRRTKKEYENVVETKKQLEEAGLKINHNVSVDKITDDLLNLDTENWENIRGPRIYEDNQEYLRARAKQQTEAKKRRKELKRLLEAEENGRFALNLFVFIYCYSGLAFQSTPNASEGSPRNSAEFSSLVKSLRSTQHKMIFVANTSLKMGAGKLAAQVGHATLGAYCNALKSEQGRAALEAWKYQGQMKVVVKGQDEEHLEALGKQAKDLGLFSYAVHDAGRTQIAAGSLTVLGIFGPIDKVNQVTGTLKLM